MDKLRIFLLASLRVPSVEDKKLMASQQEQIRTLEERVLKLEQMLAGKVPIPQLMFGNNLNDAIRIYVQPNAGSNNEQSVLTITPVMTSNGALLALIPGDNCAPGNLQSEVLLYAEAPKKPETRRQRFTIAIFRQLKDGNSFIDFGSSLSGNGPSSKAPCPVNFTFGDKVTNQFTSQGIVPYPPPKATK